MMATVLALTDLHVDAGNGIDRLVAHLVGLPESVSPNNNALAPQLFAARLSRCFRCLCHGLMKFPYDSALTGDLLSTLILASFRNVRITL
jgi:hypothetical protein